MHNAKRIDGDLPLAAVGELYELHSDTIDDLESLKRRHIQERDDMLARRNDKVFRQMCVLMKSMGLEPPDVTDAHWYVDFNHFEETGVAFLCRADDRPTIQGRIVLPGEQPLSDEPAPDGEQLN